MNMNMKRFLILSLAAFAVSGLLAEGRGDGKWIQPKDGIVNAWNMDFPVYAGVTDVNFSKAHASLMYVVDTKNAAETAQAIATFYKAKTIGKFTVGDFVARDDFMPDAIGFAGGKKRSGQGIAIFIIPQGLSTIVYIHPFKK